MDDVSNPVPEIDRAPEPRWTQTDPLVLSSVTVSGDGLTACGHPGKWTH